MKCFLLFILVSAVFSAPSGQTCTDRIIAVNSEWSLPMTQIAYRQFCTYTFKLPQNSFALLDVEAQNMAGATVYIVDDYGNSITNAGSSSNSTYSKSVALPGNFQINIQTPTTALFMIKIKVTVQKATPQSNVIGTISTDLNAPSSVLYFDQWPEGASYNIKSLKTNVNVKVALDDAISDELEDVFVYDGGVIVGTLKAVMDKQNFVSKTNKITLYMAKKPTVTGAVLVTDNSNLDPFNSHFVAFVPVSGNPTMAHLIMGDATRQGAFTLIGKSDGSTPVTVLQLTNLDNINGQFSVRPGGPVFDHNDAAGIANGNLPEKFTENVNTFYISRGMGNIKYTILAQ